jgi:hypothetical protein
MNTHAISSLAICFASAVVLCAGAAQAQPPDADSASEPPATPAIPLAPQKSAKAPYSIPFQMRPTGIATVLRTDTSFAFYDDPATGGDGSTVASMLLAAYKLTDKLSPLVRLGMVSNSPPQGDGAAGFLNPALGVTYALPLSSDLRLALFFGMALPLGSGGGDSPDPANVASNAAGIRARSAMDNAMFAVNDVVLFPGVGLSYVAHGLTLQVEATVLELLRTRGEEAQPDSARTNFTAGLHAGYFVLPELSVAAELRHQRWLSTPRAVENDPTDTLRDTTTLAAGPRLHFKVGEKSWIRPALAVALAVDDPLRRWESTSIQLDVPVIF